MERAALSRAWVAAAVGLAVVAVAWGLSRLAAPDGPAPPGVPAADRASQRRPGRDIAQRESRAPDGPRTTPGASAGPRDPFAYADEPGRAPAPRPAGQLAPAPAAAAPTPTPQPVRLVGFVRRAGRLRAALSAWGEVVLVEAGEQVGEFRVLAVDEESGVRLRAADGAEIVLP